MTPAGALAREECNDARGLVSVLEEFVVIVCFGVMVSRAVLIRLISSYTQRAAKGY